LLGLPPPVLVLRLWLWLRLRLPLRLCLRLPLRLLLRLWLRLRRGLRCLPILLLLLLLLAATRRLESRKCRSCSVSHVLKELGSATAPTSRRTRAVGLAIRWMAR